MKRLYQWLPTSVDRRVRVLAWASLAVQIILVGTGGAVRLTGSGLGCPTWPQCTDGSFVSTPEMGVHGIIEFTNRLLTFVIVVISILVFVAVLRIRHSRRDLFVLTLLQGLSIPLQAVVGGITVLTGLNPYIVGIHFVISIGLVVVTTMLVYRVYYGPRSAAAIAIADAGAFDARSSALVGSLAPAGAGSALVLVVPPWYLLVSKITAVFVGVTVVVGILTTGSGPHAGDAATPRNGLNTDVMEHIHSYPAYITFALTLVLVIAALVLRLPRRWQLTLLLIEVAQIAVGLTQSRLGLPPALVVIHMILAACLVAAMTATLLAQRRRV
ncbi:COX15/CtaA family protein [Subtercola sp. PAMC28395]|uniref:COX15/CtaA family protein n=1 Tax=Subtercola sp. PAMC28395 TaxID=2846775 RepID=UPI001C0ADECD|nr:COX15/CtaA family protein [Subtercola sp. PAMC28395]QWT23275.1 COX15/CtaA family protein [Subtercola sp. PAMC28395]